VSLRISPTEAVSRGLITQEQANQIDQVGKGRPTFESLGLAKKEPARPKVKVPPAAAQLAALSKETNEYPQRKLYDALCKELPGVPEWEKTGLIPGRKYRADIYLPPSSIVIEFDGYQFHSSLSAFQSDRLRSNLFTLHGYRMIHTFAKQVLDDEKLRELVELIVQAHYTPVMNSR
jgi:very-short-patch-repair endonuclease